MDQNLFQHPEVPDFQNPSTQKSFIEETKSNIELLQKELQVNQAEQVLLEKRIQMMKEFANDLPASDPQYNMLLTAVQMDQIELDELKLRKSMLLTKISEY